MLHEDMKYWKYRCIGVYNVTWISMKVWVIEGFLASVCGVGGVLKHWDKDRDWIWDREGEIAVALNTYPGEQWGENIQLFISLARSPHGYSYLVMSLDDTFPCLSDSFFVSLLFFPSLRLKGGNRFSIYIFFHYIFPWLSISSPSPFPCLCVGRSYSFVSRLHRLVFWPPRFPK